MTKKYCINCGLLVGWGDRNSCRNCGKVICRECSVAMGVAGDEDDYSYCPTCCEVVAMINIKKLQSKIKEAKLALNRGLEFVACDKCNEKQKRGAGNYCSKCGYRLPEIKSIKLFKGNK